MIPFRIMSPPILDTPLSTISIPPTYLTIPILLLSFGAMIGGLVYCWVHKIGWEWVPVVADNLSDQSLTEALIVGGIFGFGGLSLVAAYIVLTAEKKSGLLYRYAYLYGMTFPGWAILSYEIFKMKLSSWNLKFLVSEQKIPFRE
jgi:hypothetical protein